jgi:hypothetical protein
MDSPGTSGTARKCLTIDMLEVIMKGAILNKGESVYTYMSRVFEAIHNVQRRYNWLITDIEACPDNPDYQKIVDDDYLWLSGEEITSMIEIEDFQWIWAVFSGFPKSIAREKVLQYGLPSLEHKGYWKNPISIQHPLAVLEIVPWDSSLVLIISKDDEIVYDFMASKPLAEDLETFNERQVYLCE